MGPIVWRILKALKAHPRLRSRRMLRALGLIEGGASIREAARAVGYASHQDDGPQVTHERQRNDPSLGPRRSICES